MAIKSCSRYATKESARMHFARVMVYIDDVDIGDITHFSGK